jgi:hypothetical protein
LLTKALGDAKRRKQRGKKLNLLDEEGSGPQFFGPEEVQKAREVAAAKEEKEAQKQQDIFDKRVNAAARRVQKQEEKQQRATAAIIRRQLAAETKAAKQAEKQVAKTTREAAKLAKQAQLKDSIKTALSTDASRSKSSLLERPNLTVVVDEVAEVVPTTTRGRRVFRPARFEH